MSVPLALPFPKPIRFDSPCVLLRVDVIDFELRKLRDVQILQRGSISIKRGRAFSRTASH